MDDTDLPAKFPIPFAVDAGGSYIRPIPEASQIGVTPGAASLTDGFPPLNFTPRSAGGVPPFGEDMNGILNQITACIQWQQAGGQTPWNSAFSASIGGYPKNALVASALTDGVIWRSTTDDNVTNPDTGGAGWVLYTEQPLYTGNATAGTLKIPGTPFYFKWQTVSVGQPGSSSDLFTGGFAQTTAWGWDTAFPTACIAAWPSYPLVANGNCTFGLANITGVAGGVLYTTSGQNLRAIGNTLILGFGL